LLPDGLLPYCGERTGAVLLWLHALFVRNVALNTLARQQELARGTLRHLKARYLRTVSILRLPDREGVWGAAAFLEALAQKGSAAVADLFREWKQREPKHCVVGIYAR